MARSSGNAQAAPLAPPVAPSAPAQVADLEALALAADASPADSAPADDGLPAVYQQARNNHSELPQPTPAPAKATTPAAVETDEAEDDLDEVVTEPTATPEESTDAERFSLDEARKLRRENAKHRVELKAAKAQLAELDTLREKLNELEESSLSDQDRQAKRLERYESQLVEFKAREAKLAEREADRQLEIEVIRQARRLNIVDEDAAFRLMDREDVKYDEDGRPTNVDQVLRKLIKDRGYLVAREESRPMTANPERRSPTLEDTGRRQETNDERRLRIFGRGGSMWSNPRAQGGGVVMFDNAGNQRDRS